MLYTTITIDDDRAQMTQIINKKNWRVLPQETHNKNDVSNLIIFLFSYTKSGIKSKREKERYKVKKLKIHFGLDLFLLALVTLLLGLNFLLP